MVATFLPFALALSLGMPAARAEEAAPISAVTDNAAADALVGSADAAQKRKKKGGNTDNAGAGKKAAKKGQKGSQPSGGGNGGNGDGGEKDGGSREKNGRAGDPRDVGENTPEGARKSEPARDSASRQQGADRNPSDAQPGQSDSRGSPAREAAGSGQRSEARTTVRTSTVHAGSSEHRTADRASTERHASATHRPANYRGSTHQGASHASAERHHATAKAHAVARSHHHAAARHHAYASHHANWVRHHGHHGPHLWWHPWRAGYPVFWYHGVFVYGPPVVYGDGDGSHIRGDGEIGRAPKPEVDRAGKFSLGLRGGSYLSGFHDGSSYGDAGLGLAARYRPIDPLGFEVQWSYHDATWSQATARIQQPLSVSAELFAFPWTKVNPYVLAGVTFTDRNIEQPIGGSTFSSEDALWGPHGGVGIEFGLGKDVSLNLDVRGIGYVNKGPDDPARAGAVQANAGLNFYF